MKKNIELDKKIAKHVFNDKYKAFDLVHKEHGVFIDEYMWFIPFSPTTDTNIAIEVMEILSKKSEDEFWVSSYSYVSVSHCNLFFSEFSSDDFWDREFESGFSFGESICKAALRHLGVEYDSE